MNHSIQSEVRRYLEERAVGEAAVGFADGDSLLAAGMIDSVTMIDLIAHLESVYGITVSDDDMVPENFDSLSSIAAYVERRSTGAIEAK